MQISFKKTGSLGLKTSRIRRQEEKDRILSRETYSHPPESWTAESSCPGCIGRVICNLDPRSLMASWVRWSCAGEPPCLPTSGKVVKCKRLPLQGPSRLWPFQTHRRSRSSLGDSCPGQWDSCPGRGREGRKLLGHS